MILVLEDTPERSYSPGLGPSWLRVSYSTKSCVEHEAMIMLEGFGKDKGECLQHLHSWKVNLV